MRILTCAEASQSLAKLLKLARAEMVRIRRRDGSMFTLDAVPTEKASPFDVTGVKTKVSTADVLSAVSESRALIRSRARVGVASHIDTKTP